jgi:Pyridine nucleotide-disulphide oxidoreductase
MAPDKLLDVAIVGAGIAGVIHLRYARQAGLDALVFEKKAGVGGLWRELPSWQDIQIRPADWTVGDLPIAGPMQPQIQANIQAWVDRFDLADGIRLNCAVHRARHDGSCWQLDTAQGLVRSRHLVAATGGHNRPVVPDLPRDHGQVRELHSSALRDPAELAGRDVVVVGGGASAFDLLDQCLEHAARRIVWVHRGLRWFTPTGKPKHIAGSVRPYSKMQANQLSAAQQNEVIRTDMLARYQKFGIQSIQPARDWDVRHDQLMPGRARMLASFQRLERRPGHVVAVEGKEVLLSDGARIGAELLLWGTGYAIDLSYFEDPRIASIRTLDALGARCGGIFHSLDAPQLYFPGVFLDGIGATAFDVSLIARSIMSHVRGTARLDRVPVPHKINHLEIARYLADHDPGSYPDGRGWDFHRHLALNTPEDQPYPFV